MPRVPPRSAKQTPPPPAHPSSRLCQIAAPILLLALAAAAYHNAASEKFEFDSAGTVIINSQTRDLAYNIRRLVTHPVGGDSRLSMLSFSLNCKLNETLGRDPFDARSFLVVNVLIHALNAWLIFVLVQSLQRCVLLASDSRPARSTDQLFSFSPALLLACLFVVHPLHASSVAYIIQRRGALSCTFYLLGVLAFLRARSATPGAARWKWAAFTALCYWLSFQSKSVGLTLPLALLAIEFVLRSHKRLPLKSLTRWCLVALAVTTPLMVVVLQAQNLIDVKTLRLGPPAQPYMWNSWVHLLTESRVFLHFWKLLLLPLPQWSAVDHLTPLSTSLLDPPALAAVLCHLALLAAAIHAARRCWPLAAIGIFWFYIALIPYSVLAQTELLVEYKAYLSGVGVILILADLLRRVPSGRPLRIAMITATAALGLMLADTIHRNAIYRDPLLMWTDAADKNPGFARPRLNLGMTLMERGQADAAAPWFNEVLQISAIHQQRIARGDFLFQEAPRVRLNLAGAHISLGMLDKDARRFADAEAHFREGIRLAPDVPEGYFNLATVLMQHRRLDEAIAHFRAGLAVNAEFPDAQFLLGLALEESGQIAEARAAYAETLRLRPDHAEARQRLAHLAPRRDGAS